MYVCVHMRTYVHVDVWVGEMMRDVGCRVDEETRKSKTIWMIQFSRIWTTCDVYIGSACVCVDACMRGWNCGVGCHVGTDTRKNKCITCMFVQAPSGVFEYNLNCRWKCYYTFHWKCYVPKIHQIKKLRFLGMSRYRFKLNLRLIWIFTVKSLFFDLVGFGEVAFSVETVIPFYFTSPLHLDPLPLAHTTTRYNTMLHTATHYNTLQHTATHCNTLQHTAAHCNTHTLTPFTCTHCRTVPHTATHGNTLQHIAIHCNTLPHTTTHCDTQHAAPHAPWPPFTSAPMPPDA